MPSEPDLPTDIPSRILDEDLDPQDPFYELLLANPDLPRLRCSPPNTKYRIKRWEGSSELVEFDSVRAWLHSDYAQRTGGVVIIEEIDDRMISVLDDMFMAQIMLAFASFINMRRVRAQRNITAQILNYTILTKSQHRWRTKMEYHTVSTSTASVAQYCRIFRMLQREVT
jgi:hypothetical protein